MLVVGEKGNTLSLCGKKLQMYNYLLLSEIAGKNRMVSLRMVVVPSSCSGRRKCDIISTTGQFCLILTSVPKEVTDYII